MIRGIKRRPALAVTHRAHQRNIFQVEFAFIILVYQLLRFGRSGLHRTVFDGEFRLIGALDDDHAGGSEGVAPQIKNRQPGQINIAKARFRLYGGILQQGHGKVLRYPQLIQTIPKRCGNGIIVVANLTALGGDLDDRGGLLCGTAAQGIRGSLVIKPGQQFFQALGTGHPGLFLLRKCRICLIGSQHRFVILRR